MGRVGLIVRECFMGLNSLLSLNKFFYIKNKFAYYKQRLILYWKTRKMTDENGIWHGYCEHYCSNGNLWWKGFILHGMEYGYVEWYNDDGSVVIDMWTGYFLDGRRISRHNEEAYCLIWNRVEL